MELKVENVWNVASHFESKFWSPAFGTSDVDLTIWHWSMCIFSKSNPDMKQRRTLDQVINPADCRICRMWVECPGVYWHDHRMHTQEWWLECKQRVLEGSWKNQQALNLRKKWCSSTRKPYKEKVSKSWIHSEYLPWPLSDSGAAQVSTSKRLCCKSVDFLLTFSYEHRSSWSNEWSW